MLNFLNKKHFALTHQEDFSNFYEHSHLDVFRYLMALCSGMQDEVEDLTAETFLRAWNKRHQFTGDERAAVAWVLTIARHTLIDRRRFETVRPQEDDLDEIILADNLTAEDILVYEEQIKEVLATIRQLPLHRREIITLRYVLGWRVNQIANHLNVTENSVSVDLRRALKHIQAQLTL